MKMTRSQLDELIRYITKAVLKEYSSLSDNDPDTGSADDGVKPSDAQTSAEKSKEKRQNQQQAKSAYDQAKMKLSTDKERADSYKSQYDQWRRYDKTNNEKAVKDAQKAVASGGVTSSSPSKPSF